MRIDLNADVGESYGEFTIGEDEKLFESSRQRMWRVDFMRATSMSCRKRWRWQPS